MNPAAVLRRIADDFAVYNRRDGIDVNAAAVSGRTVARNRRIRKRRLPVQLEAPAAGAARDIIDDRRVRKV